MLRSVVQVEYCAIQCLRRGGVEDKIEGRSCHGAHNAFVRMIGLEAHVAECEK